MKKYFDKFREYLGLPKNELEDKIIERKDISDLVERLRYEGKTIVTTNGTFDFVHVGHIMSLYAAKYIYGNNNVLVVGLNSDSSVRKYKDDKYPKRPVNSQEDRAILLAALSFVDYVTIFDEVSPVKLLKIIKPDYHVKSEEGFTGIERKVVEENGGRIVLVSGISSVSTTDMIRKISKAYIKSTRKKSKEDSST